ncbi:MAG: hypothetical protein ABIP34_05995 [Rhodoferax sp.]|uniref:hypothetical protein n=2 Tax=Rhodoferax sp. TaxID=50421 RepID=UPI003266E636
MQIPPVERTVNWPPAAAGTRSGAGSAATQGPDTQPVTAAIQEETTKLEAATKPTPSVKLIISTTQEDIAKLEAAAQARTAVRAVPRGEAAEAKAVKAVGGVEASTPTAATQAVSQKVAATETGAKANNGLQNESPETAAKAAKLLEAGKEPGPNQPLSTEKDPSTDWTTTPKAVEKKPENPPPEPISKKLLDFLQQLWRAGGNAIDVAQNANQTLNPDKLGEGPLTYDDPSAVKKTTGV